MVVIVKSISTYDFQISYSSASPALSDRSRFKKYFRTSLTTDILAPTLRSTVERFNWTRVAMITQQEALFTVVRIMTFVWTILCTY